MKSILSAFIALSLLTSIRLCAYSDDDRDQIFQTATIQGLSAGLYEGFYSLGSLKKHGDFGLGTFDALDGELIFLDGVFYQVKKDGAVATMSDSVLIPFAIVTFFDQDRKIEDITAGSFAEFIRELDGKLRTKNMFFAVRINGKFDYMKVRSVPPQSKPYPPLAEALKQQSVFELKDISGTMIGFRCPSFAAKMNVPGYHFHFLAADRQSGGHVLDLRFRKQDVIIDESSSLRLVLPENSEFLNADLDGRERPPAAE